MAAFLVLFAIGAALAAGPTAAAHAATPREFDLLAAINEARASYGLRPLAPSLRLQSDAEGYAGTLVASGRFVHADLRPGTGELIAWGSLGTIEARQIVGRWLASPEHKPILLMPQVRWIGAGIVFGQLGGERLGVVVVRVSM